MGHCFSHLTRTDRYRLEAYLKAKMPIREIAKELHVHVSTIYREIKRARTVFRNSDWTEEERYNPDEAERIYRTTLTAKGPALKIGRDLAMIRYIEDRIIRFKRSPAAALADISLEGKRFSVTLCTSTVYSYIDKGVFLNLTNEDLPLRGRKKRAYQRVRKVKRPPAGESIENRPSEVDSRETFGHWEMDTVYSAKKSSNASLLVLTERKTREELIVKMPDRTAASTCHALDGIEMRFGTRFGKIFRSITVDNGSEFSDVATLKRSILQAERQRTEFYYCHPYTSCERGSNERQNGMIRRIYPKGTDFGTLTDEDIRELERWINEYPRALLGWRTSEMAFQECLAEAG